MTVMWYTPTTGMFSIISIKALSSHVLLGLGCRSGAYLLYAINSTVIWAIMLTSSVLAHISTRSLPHDEKHAFTGGFSGYASAFLRRTGKVMAALNTAWIICSCVFQFSNVFDRCYCNSSVLGRGAKMAYNVMKLVDSDKSSIIHAWIGGVALALLSSFAFIGFVQIYLDPPLSPQS